MAKTLVWSIPDFVNHRQPKNYRSRSFRPELLKGVITASAIIGVMIFTNGVAYADSDVVETVASVSTQHPISPIFDRKIWPLFLDIGGPLAKTMMAIGIYKCIRNDVDKGWKMTYRAGIGLVGLYTIDGAIHILEGIGQGLEQI